MLNKALLNMKRLGQTRRLINSSIGLRTFTNVSVVGQDAAQSSVDSAEAQWARIGADQKFDQQKHAYVLTFPWNFPEIVSSFETKHRIISDSSYWGRFVDNSGAKVDFNNLYRQFHQYCSVPDPVGI